MLSKLKLGLIVIITHFIYNNIDYLSVQTASLGPACDSLELKYTL